MFHKIDKPIIENDFYIKICYEPEAILLKSPNDKKEKVYPIYINNYKLNEKEFWKVRFLHIRVNNVNSKLEAINVGKCLVQSYIQGRSDAAGS